MCIEVSVPPPDIAAGRGKEGCIGPFRVCLKARPRGRRAEVRKALTALNPEGLFLTHQVRPNKTSTPPVCQFEKNLSPLAVSDTP